MNFSGELRNGEKVLCLRLHTQPMKGQAPDPKSCFSYKTILPCQWLSLVCPHKSTININECLLFRKQLSYDMRAFHYSETLGSCFVTVQRNPIEKYLLIITHVCGNQQYFRIPEVPLRSSLHLFQALTTMDQMKRVGDNAPANT